MAGGSERVRTVYPCHAYAPANPPPRLRYASERQRFTLYALKSERRFKGRGSWFICWRGVL